VAGMNISRFCMNKEKEIYVCETDILFNGVDFYWTREAGDVYLPTPELNAGSILAHELGHSHGMDHEYALPTSTMFYAYLGGDWMATLSGDDMRGICENYPNGEDACQDDEDCSDIDASERWCAEIDGIRVCDELRDPIGGECSRTYINCEEVCVFTTSTATEGYCTITCPDGECPCGWDCGEANLLLPTDAGAVCIPSETDTGCDTSTPGDTSDSQLAPQDSSEPTEDDEQSSEEGCGCAGGPTAPATLGALLLTALGLRRRSSRGAQTGLPSTHPPTGPSTSPESS